MRDRVSKTAKNLFLKCSAFEILVLVKSVEHVEASAQLEILRKCLFCLRKYVYKCVYITRQRSPPNFLEKKNEKYNSWRGRRVHEGQFLVQQLTSSMYASWDHMEELIQLKRFQCTGRLKINWKLIIISRKNLVGSSSGVLFAVLFWEINFTSLFSLSQLRKKRSRFYVELGTQ